MPVPRHHRPAERGARNELLVARCSMYRRGTPSIRLARGFLRAVVRLLSSLHGSPYSRFPVGPFVKMARSGNMGAIFA